MPQSRASHNAILCLQNNLDTNCKIAVTINNIGDLLIKVIDDNKYVV